MDARPLHLLVIDGNPSRREELRMALAAAIPQGSRVSVLETAGELAQRLAEGGGDLAFVAASLPGGAALAAVPSPDIAGPPPRTVPLVLLGEPGDEPPAAEILQSCALACLPRAELLSDPQGAVERALREAPLRWALAEALAGRRRAEACLREEEKRFSDLAVNEPGVIYQWAQRTDGSFGFTYASPRIAEIFQVPADRPNDVLALVHPDDAPRFLASLEEIAREPRPWSFEGRFLDARDGSVRWWRAVSRPTSITPEEALYNGLLFDVTAEKEAAASLAAAHERLALALRGSRLTLWDWDLASNEVYLSEPWRSLLERADAPATLPAGELQALLHPDDAPRVLAAISAARKGTAADYSVEHRIRTASGWKWIASHGMVTRRDDTGWALRMTGTNADITERKRGETALAEAKAAAESANRAKSDFLARMSHEIRTPLNGVLGLADLLGSTRLDADQAEYVRRMQNAGQHLLALISNILDLAKIEAGKMEVARAPFRLASVVLGTLDVLRPVAESQGLRFAVTLEPGLPDWVDGDAVKLRQLLNNLGATPSSSPPAARSRPSSSAAGTPPGGCGCGSSTRGGESRLPTGRGSSSPSASSARRSRPRAPAPAWGSPSPAAWWLSSTARSASTARRGGDPPSGSRSPCRRFHPRPRPRNPGRRARRT
jgi:signal transduction histidine kinase